MTNLLSVLPDFDLNPYTHILPSLERAQISTTDLLTLDAIDVAKRAQVPPGEVRKLVDALLEGLHTSSRDTSVAGSTSPFISGGDLVKRWATISTLDDELDAALLGGIGAGCLTEFVGESAAGKTQFLLTLLLSVQLPFPDGLGKSALYISTEAPLQTTRLAQILSAHPKLCALPDARKPSLKRIQSTHIHDLEAQEHILRYQVPVAIQRHDVGLIVVDSIAANYRPEFGKSVAQNGYEPLARRNHQLAQTGALLRSLAHKHNLAVVVANQIADRFASFEPLHPAVLASQQSHRSSPASTAPSLPCAPSPAAPTLLSTDDPFALDHQQLFFSGWGDSPPSPSATTTVTAPAPNLKTPSLGLVWANQLAARIALLRDPSDVRAGAASRTCKVVFSAWAPPSATEYEIWTGGVRSLRARQRAEETRKVKTEAETLAGVVEQSEQHATVREADAAAEAQANSTRW
nr:dna repair protein rhp57 [Quercus suber]